MKFREANYKLLAGVGAVAAVIGITSAVALGNVRASEKANYIDPASAPLYTTAQTELADSKGAIEIDADNDANADIYLDIDGFRKMMELTDAQVDANTENIASNSDVYDSSSTYGVGDLCIYDGVIYQCTTAISSGEEWDNSHWEQASLVDGVNDLNGSLNTLSFGQDSEGNWGYIVGSGGADSVTPFKSQDDIDNAYDSGYSAGNTSGYSSGYSAGVSATKVGTATAANVLTSKTFTNSSSVGISGTMANNGALNWSPASSTSKNIAAGYYSGGTISTANAYTAGYNSGYSAGAQDANWVKVGTISWTGDYTGTNNTGSYSYSKSAPSSQTFSVTSKYSNYTSLTASDFIVAPGNGVNSLTYTIESVDYTYFYSPSYSYSSSSGTLTVRPAYVSSINDGAWRYAPAGTWTIYILP